MTYAFADRPRYLEYYMLHLANDLSLVKRPSGPSNPFVQEMLPLALDSAALLHALAALAAIHLSGKLRCHVEGDVQFHDTRAANLVDIELARSGAVVAEATLATLLTFSLFPKSRRRQSVVIDPAKYLSMARRAIVGLGDPTPTATSCRRFLLELFAYQDMRLSPRSHTPPLPISHTLRARVHSPILCFALELFQILGRLLYLGETSGWDLAAGPYAEAKGLLQALHAWESPMMLAWSTEGALADALRLASILSLQEFLGQRSDTDYWPKEHTIERLIAQISSIEPSHPAATGFVWPWILLVAGCNTHSLSASAGDILARFDVQKGCLPGRDSMRQALEERWHHGADCHEPLLLSMLISD